MFPKRHAVSYVLVRFGETGMTHSLEEKSDLWTQVLFWGVCVCVGGKKQEQARDGIVRECSLKSDQKCRSQSLNNYFHSPLSPIYFHHGRA